MTIIRALLFAYEIYFYYGIERVYFYFHVNPPLEPYHKPIRGTLISVLSFAPFVVNVVDVFVVVIVNIVMIVVTVVGKYAIHI
jgi:hypothetical protein